MNEGESPSQLSAGSEFAGYRIERRLGQGGMGLVYEATEPGLERRVALKLIIPEVSSEEVFLERFAFESKIAAQVEHPNVVPIYAAGEHEGIPFIAMRLVTGSDLGKRLAESGRLDPALATNLIDQVSHGLDAIHAAGLIHRDVKPGNVLLSGGEGTEHAYITDFGVARDVASASGLTRTGRFVGTLDYVAPEQIVGDTVDAKADVYALACLLYKCLTGEIPFPKEGEAARLYAHLHDDPPAPSRTTPLVPEALDRVIARGMAKRPDERYPSAGDLGRAAVSALSGEPVSRPERTVARGAALTAETESVGDEGIEPIAPTAAGESQETAAAGSQQIAAADGPQTGAAGGPPSAAAGGPPSAAGENPPPAPPDGPPGAAPPAGRPPSARKGPSPATAGRRRLIAGAVALVALVGIGIAVASSGGGSGGASTEPLASNPPSGNQTTTNPQNQQNSQNSQNTKPQPNRLSKTELTAALDGNCRKAQAAFDQVQAKYQAGGLSLVEYTQGRFNNSADQLQRLGRIVPPKDLQTEFDRYAALITQVHGFDREARDAATRNDPAAVDAAYAKIDNQLNQRHELAVKLGSTICNPLPA